MSYQGEGQTDDKKSSPTTTLARWVADLTAADIPHEVLTRAKYLMLDGIGCGLVGAHLPWSQRAADALFDLEPEGNATIIGWDKKLPPMTAALLNGSFIQGFELDDWHSEAPLHSNSILLPALFAAAQHQATKKAKSVSGADLLLALVTGFEVGLGLHGTHVLSTGWHSGAVFGPPAAAASVSQLLGLNADQVEDALGTACTQAGGLMSAQFGSDVKRMQHGFAARNGLVAAILAQGGYTGIRGVFELDYGGYLKQFSAGNGKEPQYLPDEICKDLGTTWKIDGVRVKPYSSMAATHPSVDCVRELQKAHPECFEDLSKIKSITINMAEAAFQYGGWRATKPLTATGAQMSDAFVAATQIVHRAVSPAQFRADMLDNDDVWQIVERTTCKLEEGASQFKHTMRIEMADGKAITPTVNEARGVDPALTNDAIVEKWKTLSKDILDSQIVDRIKDMVLALDERDDITPLLELLGNTTRNPIA